MDLKPANSEASEKDSLSSLGLDSLKDDIIDSHVGGGEDTGPSIGSLLGSDDSTGSLGFSDSDGSSTSDDSVSGVVSDAPDESGVDVSKMSIEEPIEGGSGSMFDFSDQHADTEKKSGPSFFQKIGSMLNITFNGSLLLYYVIGLLFFIFFVLGATYFYYAERYVYYTTQPYEGLSDSAQQTLTKIQSYSDILGLIGLDTGSQKREFFVVADNDKYELQNIIKNSALSYGDKYHSFYSYVSVLDRDFPTLYKSFVDVKEKLVTYPFFPSSLTSVIDPTKDLSLQRSLLSLEGVKLRTALSVFSKFDTFVSQFALTSGRSKKEIREFLDVLMKRGDMDIDYYLSTCYLNPYEIYDRCTQYGDFSRMYDVYDKDEKIDTILFAQLMGFIEDKLENSILPSLEIGFSDFDTKKQELTLSVGVNTLPDDSLQLLSSGVLNPHVYIIGHMINFLRQSKFVVSNDVSINELDIQKLVVPVGSKEITVLTSSFDFVLPLQKNTEREITDFFVAKKKYSAIDDKFSYLDNPDNITGFALSGSSDDSVGSGSSFADMLSGVSLGSGDVALSGDISSGSLLQVEDALSGSTDDTDGVSDVSAIVTDVE